MPKHRIAIIGLGMAVTPHARSIVELSDRVEVAYAFSPSESRRKSFAEKFPFPLADSLDAILADKSVDCVEILTPPNTHLDLVRKCAAAGKHILLEKPLEITTARAVELVEAAHKAGVTLAVMLQHRFRPAALKLRAMLQAGEVGSIVNCSTVIRLWRPQSYYDVEGRGTKARDGGGVLITQGIHTLDLMLSLAGPIAQVRGYAMTSSVHRMETEDLVAAAVKYENGAIGTIDATTAAYPGFPERIEIVGERATASLVGSDLVVAHHDGRVSELKTEFGAGGTGADPMAFPNDWHRAAIADFLDAIDGKRQPLISGRDALKVQRLIDALLEAGATGATVKVVS
ncbi:MAG: Gfo/Idh/MocA family oxidoreductase [Alphaproteobacteria bacterium]|nr:MAG: Gfo/Idh/MocA family oxidoreductase [Alphaproteobacteria bacterium]